MLSLIISIAISGLIIGALGRLVVPGPNPMSIFSTILIGIAGSAVGGIIGHLIFGYRYAYEEGLSLIVAILCTAILVAIIQRPKRIR